MNPILVTKDLDEIIFMKQHLAVCALIAALVSIGALRIGATPITILNPSFENDPLTPSKVTPPSDWTSDAPFRQPVLIGFVGTNHGYDVAPDGKNYLMIVGGHTESQTIDPKSYTPAVGDVLTLTVGLAQVGNPKLAGSIALTIDGTIVAHNSDSTTGVPKYPNFADAMVTYKITPEDLNKKVGVALIDPIAGVYPTSADNQLFDNVRLDMTPAAAAGALPPQVAANLASNAVAPVIKGPRKGFRVFTVGHSYHFMNYSFPDVLQDIARSGGFPDHEIVGIDCIFGSKVIQHWDVKDDNPDFTTKPALRAGAVDVLTLVGLFLPDEGIEKFAQLGFEHNPNIRVLVQEIWLPWDANKPHYWDPPLETRPATLDHNAATVEALNTQHQPYFQGMNDLISGINQKLGKQVVFAVPVGQAVIALRGKIIAGQAPGLKSQEELFADTLGHPQPPIQALTGYCYYAEIYKKNPVGLPVPSVLKQSKIPSEQLDGLNHLLQQLAWDAVTHHPLSGVTP